MSKSLQQFREWATAVKRTLLYTTQVDWIDTRTVSGDLL